MSVASSVDDHDDRRGHALDRSALQDDLESWGKWIEENSDFQGYSSISAFMAYSEGGRAQLGHKILCRDPPPWFTRTHICVCSLHEELQFVLGLLYIVRMKEDNTFWSLDEKLRIVGMPYSVFRERIAMARSILLGLV